MLVKDVLKISATYLQLQECLDAQVLGGETLMPNATTQEQLILLTQCLNLCINEIATEQILLNYCEQKTVVSDCFSLSALTKNAINIKKIKTLLGSDVDFYLTNSNVYVPSGTYEIVYNYTPDEATLSASSICEDFMGKVSAKALAYGVCKEYCLITGLFEEAVMWNEQFQQSIKIASKNKNNIVLKQRRWL